jgi:hypothetical protein
MPSGLIFVDRPTRSQPFSAAISASGGFLFSDMSESRITAPGPSTFNGLFGIVIDFWARKATKNDIQVLNQNPANSLSSFTARAVATSWLGIVELVSAILSNNEYFTYGFERLSVKESTYDIRTELSNLREGIGATNSARRRIMWYIEHVRYNALVLGCQLGSCRSGNGPSDGSEFGEFEIILEQLHFAKARSESLSPIILGACSILEAQLRAAESSHVDTLTFMAGLFVPITVVSGIFSMSDEYLPGRPHFWIFWATAIVVIILVVLITHRFPRFRFMIQTLRR